MKKKCIASFKTIHFQKSSNFWGGTSPLRHPLRRASVMASAYAPFLTSTIWLPYFVVPPPMSGPVNHDIGLWQNQEIWVTLKIWFKFEVFDHPGSANHDYLVTLRNLRHIENLAQIFDFWAAPSCQPWKGAHPCLGIRSAKSRWNTPIHGNIC